MRNRFGSLFVSALLLVLAGCAGVKTPPSTTAPVASVEQPQPPPVVEGKVESKVEGNIVDLGPRPAISENKAVIALLDRAHTDNAAGQREASEASLERALRIEPRNPWLWLELAQLRLAQGQYAQAITLARKSNSFAGGKHRVQAENWQVIGQARVAQGDTAGAEQAFKLAEKFAKQAKAE